MNTITDDQIAEIESTLQEPRITFRCVDCEGVYTDQKVSQCDCLGSETYKEGFVLEQPASAILALIARLREAERDAARYLWILKHYGEFHGERTLAALALQHGSLDAAIDEAMLSAREAAE